MSNNTVAASVKKGIAMVSPFISTIRSYGFKYNEASSRISMSFCCYEPEMSMTSSEHIIRPY